MRVKVPISPPPSHWPYSHGTHWNNNLQETERVEAAVPLSTSTRQVICSNPGRNTGYPDMVSRGSQSLRVNTRLVHLLHHSHFPRNLYNFIIDQSF
jgi:hypothetical protein